MKHQGKIEQICSPKLKPPPTATSLHRDPYDMDLSHSTEQQPGSRHSTLTSSQGKGTAPATHHHLYGLLALGIEARLRKGGAPGAHGPARAARPLRSYGAPPAARHRHRRHLRLPRGESAGRRVPRCGRTACSELPARTALECHAARSLTCWDG